jgi:3'-phosphoadenosine 5'-phosphosulfate sulfotransferase (PAPS reductase)/FAD synthetase
VPYNKLHDKGYRSIGDVHSTAKVVADEEVPSLHRSSPCTRLVRATRKQHLVLDVNGVGREVRRRGGQGAPADLAPDRVFKKEHVTGPTREA